MRGHAANLAVASSPLASPSRSEPERAQVMKVESRDEPRGHGISRLWPRALGVFVIVLGALVPTVGDFGLTWDEPAYRYSQVMSAQWWEQLGRVRSIGDARALLDPATLLYFWPYGRFGINFHPPLAGQLNLASHAIFGHWMKDMPSRRMATVIEFALAITIGFSFLARRYGGWVGFVAAGSLLLMPRLYGQAHLVDTDTAGVLLWSATAMAFWKGLHEPNARRWRVAVGILLGLAFLEKMGAVVVLLPLLLWLVCAALARPPGREAGRAAWIDGICTSVAMLAPLALAFLQIQILQRQLKPPWLTDFFVDRPSCDVSGVVLALPLAIWVVRRLLGRLLPRHRVWGVERPCLETWTAILAFAPVIGWLGNPAWWRETLPRLAHYYTLSNQRQGALPSIQILYFGQVYEYSLPWHNAWVLLGITVPTAILGAAVIGIFWAIGRIRQDRLPLYFLVHFLTLPVIRMLDTPAHDGVRLFLPTFFFLAAFAGWGTVWLADALARLVRVPARLTRLALAAIVLGSAGQALVRIHPYELSYYNELIGGTRKAWNRGFELSYWYDAFNGPVLEALNRRLPAHAEVDFFNHLTDTSVMVFQVHQSLGELRGDVLLGARREDRFPYVWLLTQDSKATAFTRLLFAMRPWYTSEPAQLGGARVASVADPVAVSRAYALQILLDAPDRRGEEPPAAPRWVREHAPWLARLWGDGLKKASRLAVHPTILDWSHTDPEGLLAAAKCIAAKEPLERNKEAGRLMELLTTETNPDGKQVRHFTTEQLLRLRPEALVEAVQILNSHRDEIVQVMTRYGYTDPPTIGGYLDRALPNPNIQLGG
jgi:4-amino-4-deoxy-L-arabinose transferase-like glycosyltransferase